MGGHAARRNCFKAPQGTAGKAHARLPGRQVNHPEIPPEHALAKTGAERFGGRLFCGKTARVARARVDPAVATAPLKLGKDPVEKAVAKPADRLLDSTDVDQVA